MSRNPFIQIAVEHFAKGDKLLNIYIDDPDAEIPEGVIALLEDGTEVRHTIPTDSRREFYELFREASNWWCKVQWEEIHRVS